jgi:hypothetical protein
VTASDKPEKLDNPEQVGLPPTPFLYHLDQVATMLGKSVDDLCNSNLYFVGRSIGRLTLRQIKTINIAANQDDQPEWRVTEGELVRWLKVMGIRVFSRGRVV